MRMWFLMLVAAALVALSAIVEMKHGRFIIAGMECFVAGTMAYVSGIYHVRGV